MIKAGWLLGLHWRQENSRLRHQLYQCVDKTNERNDSHNGYHFIKMIWVAWVFLHARFLGEAAVRGLPTAKSSPRRSAHWKNYKIPRFVVTAEFNSLNCTSRRRLDCLCIVEAWAAFPPRPGPPRQRWKAVSLTAPIHNADSSRCSSPPTAPAIHYPARNPHNEIRRWAWAENTASEPLRQLLGIAKNFKKPRNWHCSCSVYS